MQVEQPGQGVEVLHRQATTGHKPARGRFRDAERFANTIARQARRINGPADSLRKAEKAFCKGNKGLLLSRVECGKWCHEIYVFRQEENHKDRGFTSTIIFNRLAPHADSKRECDGSEMALMYKAVEFLATGDNWKSLTVGKLLVLKKLVKPVDGTEVYGVFDIARTEQAKALFAWACGEGLKKPSGEDINNRVLELVDPKRYAEPTALELESAARWFLRQYTRWRRPTSGFLTGTGFGPMV